MGERYQQDQLRGRGLKYSARKMGDHAEFEKKKKAEVLTVGRRDSIRKTRFGRAKG